MPNEASFTDWLAIASVKAAYCRLLDTKDWEGWGNLFAEDAVLDTTGSGGTVERGRPAIVASVKRSIGNVQTAHQVHFPEIALDGQYAASAVWAMQDRLIWPDGTKLTGYGHYHDRYVRRDGRWFIAEQKLTRLIMERETPAN